MRLFHSICLFLCALAAAAALPDGVQHLTYTFDTSNDVHVLKAERSRLELNLQMGFAQGKRGYGTSTESTGAIAARYDAPPGLDVAGAVNGSFFDYENGTGTQQIFGICGTGGNFVQYPEGSTDPFGLTDAREFVFQQGSVPSVQALILPDATLRAIDKVNWPRAADQLVLYTNDWGATTGADNTGYEVVLSNVNYPLRLNKYVTGTVTQIRDGLGNSTIPAGGMVLSAHGAAASAIRPKIAAGNTLTIYLSMTPEPASSIFNNAQFMIGSKAHILRGGVVDAAYWAHHDELAKYRHARTAIAWNATHIFLVTADQEWVLFGSPHPSGMTFLELANFLKDTVGASDAVTLDGGGSTTMIVDGALVNDPKFGSQRAIANAVLLVKKPIPAVDALSDTFPASGRQLAWEDKFVFNAVSAFAPAAPGGDGYAMTVKHWNGGFETTRIGAPSDADYSVQAQVYCEYRPELAADGYEEYGLFARDNGNGAFTTADFGGGNCYALLYRGDTGQVRAGKVANGVFTEFAGLEPVAVTASGWHRFAISLRGPHLVFAIDETPVAVAEDAAFARGYAGIGYREQFATNANMHGARVDNFERGAPVALTPATQWELY